MIKTLHKVNIKMILMMIGVTILTIIFLILLYQYDNKYTVKANLTEDGISLVPKNSIRFLADGWEFYPDKLLFPQDFKDSLPTDNYYITSLGDYPNLSLFHEDGNPYGVSTYRLHLRGDGLFSLYLQEPLCASKIFADGELIGENGSVSPADYHPLIRDGVYQFFVNGDTELIIQTANYSHYYGGLYYPPALGNSKNISYMVALRMIFYGLLCFSSLSLALFSTAVWFGRKGHRDLASFYFGLLSLSFSVRVCYPFLRFFGVPVVRSLYALEDIAAMLGIYCVFRISLLLYAPKLQNQVRTIICAAAMGMCGVAGVIPLLILPSFPAFAQWYGILVSWYKVLAAVCLWGISLYGANLDRPLAKFSLAAVTSYSVFLFANVFHINAFEPIYAGWQDEYGSFLLVLLFGAIMVRRSHIMAAENRHLTEHLQAEVDKKTKHLTMLLEERSRLISELGHDMKSPVTALSNMIQIIRLGNLFLDDDAQNKMQIMEERCNDLAERLHSIQKLTADTGGLLEMQELSLNHFLTEFHRDIQSVVEMSGPDFACRLTNLPCPVLADPDKLRRAFENLVFNAADFTPPEGNINLTLEREGSYACIRIADTGCGIPEDALLKIFDRFYTTRTDQGGQGLGLAITKSIIAEHRGELSVQSDVGAGTVFVIRLPLLE